MTLILAFSLSEKEPPIINEENPFCHPELVEGPLTFASASEGARTEKAR